MNSLAAELKNATTTEQGVGLFIAKMEKKYPQAQSTPLRISVRYNWSIRYIDGQGRAVVMVMLLIFAFFGLHAGASSRVRKFSTYHLCDPNKIVRMRLTNVFKKLVSTLLSTTMMGAGFVLTIYVLCFFFLMMYPLPADPKVPSQNSLWIELFFLMLFICVIFNKAIDIVGRIGLPEETGADFSDRLLTLQSIELIR